MRKLAAHQDRGLLNLGGPSDLLLCCASDQLGMVLGHKKRHGFTTSMTPFDTSEEVAAGAATKGSLRVL